ncbi:MAG TPA: lipid II flippase MurJ [Streptosporangiaceae bacterium]|nr:lipid II flippase MurJ [Streptosporangiaceae bacterium]
MTGRAVPVTRDGQDPHARWPAGASIGRSAALIAALTIAARLLGLARTLVFAKTVGATCLGTAYATANLVPNIVYDVVLGGALTSIMVPVLARPARLSGDDAEAAAEVSQTSSALLTWTVVILVPVSVVIAVAAQPLADLLNPHNVRDGCLRQQHALVTITGHMLAVFAPQVVLYGLAVVLYGILQAHRRFAAPALAPVISSLVVITAYLIFVPFGGTDVAHLQSLSLTAELILSVGTTAGVGALVVTALVPAWRLHIRVRPTLRFPAGIGRRVGGLAAYGIIALLTQDVAALIVLLLANGHGPRGALVLYGYGWQVFEALYAVLAISIAVSAFPVLSVREGEEFDQTVAGSARAVLLLCLLGTAVLVAIAVPAAHFLASYPHQVPELAAGLALFAIGLTGYGLVACLSRVLLAAGRTSVAAAIVGGGWLLVIVVDVVLVALCPARWVVAALAVGNTVGLTAAGLALVVAVRRARGPGALQGTLRVGISGLAAAAAGAAAGAGIAAVLPPAGAAAEGLIALLAAVCAVAVFGAVAWLLDDGDLRAALARARRAVVR